MQGYHWGAILVGIVIGAIIGKMYGASIPGLSSL
jgi:hypothetical protein